MDFTDSISVMPSEQFLMKIYDISHHTQNVWLRYLRNNCFQKLCRRSTVTSVYPTCTYWRECKHNLKLKRKLNFLAHPVRQYRLIMFTNTGCVSKTKSNLT